MVRNRKVARAISDCGWRSFREMLEYKAARYGRRVKFCEFFGDGAPVHSFRLARAWDIPQPVPAG
jgi:hypothetical protein